MTGGGPFSSVLVLGDNGQIGADTYNYLKNYIDNYKEEPEDDEQYPMPVLADIQIKDLVLGMNRIYSGKFENIIIYNYNRYGDCIILLAPDAWLSLYSNGQLEWL